MRQAAITRSGWAGWLGGYEQARQSQEIKIASTASELSFTGDCNSESGYMEALVDDVREFYVNGSSPHCDNLGYTVQSVDISDYADDGADTIAFHAETFRPADLFLFFVDDVYIPGIPSACSNEIFTDGFESN